MNKKIRKREKEEGQELGDDQIQKTGGRRRERRTRSKVGG